MLRHSRTFKFYGFPVFRFLKIFKVNTGLSKFEYKTLIVTETKFTICNFKNKDDLLRCSANNFISIKYYIN